jgi:hypothetical protein
MKKFFPLALFIFGSFWMVMLLRAAEQSSTGTATSPNAYIGIETAEQNLLIKKIPRYVLAETAVIESSRFSPWSPSDLKDFAGTYFIKREKGIIQLELTVTKKKNDFLLSGKIVEAVPEISGHRKASVASFKFDDSPLFLGPLYFFNLMGIDIYFVTLKSEVGETADGLICVDSFLPLIKS